MEDAHVRTSLPDPFECDGYSAPANGHSLAHASGSAKGSVGRLFGRTEPCRQAVVGVLPGEGIGPEVTDAALTVLRAVLPFTPCRFEVLYGGSIGLAAERVCRQPLSGEVIGFIRDVFDRGGHILAGAGGGRFVYDARREFDLFCKVNPLVPSAELRGAGVFNPSSLAGVDIMIIRETRAGVYQGDWSEEWHPSCGRIAKHSFSYSEAQVRRIVEVAARLAASRRGELTVVTKPHGVPTVSRLWIDCARDAAREAAVLIRELEIDYAAFLMVHQPRLLDVVVAANLLGDILSDLGGVLLGSRGLCYGASFSPTGEGIFQTNHGAANDLAGSDRANPVGQVLSLAMLLGEGFGLEREASLVTSAIRDVWSRGYRTDDIAEPGCHLVGTREMGKLLAESVARLAESGL
jgi:3-isopropylmalate dehydrogenase